MVKNLDLVLFENQIWQPGAHICISLSHSMQVGPTHYSSGIFFSAVQVSAKHFSTYVYLLDQPGGPQLWVIQTWFPFTLNEEANHLQLSGLHLSSQVTCKLLFLTKQRLRSHQLYDPAQPFTLQQSGYCSPLPPTFLCLACVLLLYPCLEV